MKVLSFIENPDGSATIEVSMSEEEKTKLLNHAINDIIKLHLEKLDKEDKDPNN